MLEAAQFIADVFTGIFQILIAYSIGRALLGLVVLSLVVSFLFSWLPKSKGDK